MLILTPLQKGKMHPVTTISLVMEPTVPPHSKRLAPLDIKAPFSKMVKGRDKSDKTQFPLFRHLPAFRNVLQFSASKTASRGSFTSGRAGRARDTRGG